MKVFVCIEDRGGMMFNSRRESRDRLVILDMLVEAGAGRLYISPFSEKLFEGNKQSVIVSRFPFDEVPEDGSLFVEDMDLAGYEERIDTLVVYHWNRVYPYDRVLDIDMSRYEQIGEKDFAGYSHDRITKKTYRLIKEA